jgi:hypothetical protein
MKRTLFILTIFLASLGAISQTATNFTCNDCAGVNHDLFTELGAGDVIVLCWVMPCSSCVPTTLTTYNVVQSFALSYPGRVHMYIVDDYANTSCTSLSSWCNSNGFTNSTRFSNASIKMADYGTAGMPKVVVVGNYSHHVYYNANNNVNPTTLSAAITTAIQDFSVGITEPASKEIGTVKSYPNPVADQISLTFSIEKTSKFSLAIFNYLAKQAIKPKTYEYDPGEHTITINTSGFENGIYFARFQTESGIKTTRFVVSH